MKRIKGGEDEPIKVGFTMRERTLILDHASPDPHLADRLQMAEVRQGKVLAGFTLYDIEELCGFVAAEANHTKDQRLQRELERLFDRLTDVMERYDDGSWQGNFEVS